MKCGEDVVRAKKKFFFCIQTCQIYTRSHLHAHNHMNGYKHYHSPSCVFGTRHTLYGLVRIFVQSVHTIYEFRCCAM